jgi:hypothetical protein
MDRASNVWKSAVEMIELTKNIKKYPARIAAVKKKVILGGNATENAKIAGK